MLDTLDTIRPVRFERVLTEELDHIDQARRAHGLAPESDQIATDEDGASDRARQANLCGLALSGGGIRSATFNLGIIQALARHRLLGRIDYLSTVSGGGYVGSWLSAWIHRHPQGVHGVQQEMRAAISGATPEPREIGWLRDYSNYLMLRPGLFSGDTWATIAIYLRNLWLNLALIVACLGFGLLLPRLLIEGLATLPFEWFGVMGMVLMAIAIACIVVNLDGDEERWGWLRSQQGVMFTIMLPGLVSALVLAHAFLADFPGAVYVREIGAALWPEMAPMHMLSWVFAAAIVYALPWTTAALISRMRPSANASQRFRWRPVVLFSPLVGILIGLLTYAYSVVAIEVANAHWEASAWLISGFGAPALLMIVFLALVLHIGLVSRGFSEDIREWWGRLGGWSTLVMLAWSLGFAVVIYAPAVVGWAEQWIAVVGIGWIVSTIAGVLLGRTASTGTLNAGRIMNWVVDVLPIVFVAGLVVTVAIVLHAMLVPEMPLCVAPSEDGGSAFPRFGDHARVAYCELSLTRLDQLIVWMAGLAAAAFLLQLRVDVNVFSLAPFYRNRLLRCYLGASRQGARRPHPFTGFDREDDIALSDLAGPAASDGPHRLQRPYPIVNTAINLTTGQKLAWQQRKAGSFVFTPLYCGYQMPDEGGARWSGRYCPTPDYVSASVQGRGRNALALSNAVTISGAAASPNAGYHSSPAVAFLLTVFSVRLGSWFQNPRRPEIWRKPGPVHSLIPLLSELFGMSNDKSDFVYLSDGGHFENLGIYELVRRRCRFIIACDASCDPDLAFEDLGNAVRKCRIDLGVDIEIDTSALMPLQGTGLSMHHCALGVIRYDRLSPRGGVGYLLYVKATMSGSEPKDVAQYRSAHPAFPHQSTADQFFDEPQFESYRRLGLHIGETVLRSAVARSSAEGLRAGAGARDETGGDIDLEQLFRTLRERWYPPLPVPDGAFTRHADTLDQILERIRGDDRLRFLDRQLHPEWPYLEGEAGAASRAQPWLPDDVFALRAAFYLCESIIQLMENVYTDLRMESTYDHPDNRGWMNLFRRFAAAGMLRITWAVSGATFGARFQSFCEHHLGLGASEIHAEAPLSVESLLQVKETPALATARSVIDALRRAGEIADRDTVVRFSLVIRGGARSLADAKSFGFPVAFAVLRQAPGAEAGWRLRYFRVADHLQRMGLGWRVTLALLAAYPRTELDMATRAPELRTPQSEADRARYARLFRAAQRSTLRA